MGTNPMPRPVARRMASLSSGALIATVCDEPCWSSIGSPSRNDARDQIVIVRGGDFDVDEIARLRTEPFRHVVDEHLSVDFRRLRFESRLQQQLALFRNAFQQRPEVSTDQGAILSLRNACLLSHQLGP